MRSRKKKGIVGIEAAIVLIAFVIVAAALAFVALNMGLFTTQKSKEVIQRGLEESTTALEVDGSVIGYTPDGNVVNVTAIPIKVAPGRGQVDLAKDKTSITLILPSNTYEDINKGVYVLVANNTGYYYLVNPTNPSDEINLASQNASLDVIISHLWNKTPNGTEAYVIFVQGNNNTVLEYGEKAILLVSFGKDGVPSYQSFTVEVKPPEGAPLTVDRTIPATLPSSGTVDLG
ncbi:MAG: flagellin [Desulfurococcales archaeon]|nr:flagellin [Desulfurococcales archaeon]